MILKVSHVEQPLRLRLSFLGLAANQYEGELAMRQPTETQIAERPLIQNGMQPSSLEDSIVGGLSLPLARSGAITSTTKVFRATSFTVTVATISTTSVITSLTTPVTACQPLMSVLQPGSSVSVSAPTCRFSYNITFIGTVSDAYTVQCKTINDELSVTTFQVDGDSSSQYCYSAGDTFRRKKKMRMSGHCTYFGVT
nr:hypothetical protein CFP56_22291 [Quercus suber]